MALRVVEARVDQLQRRPVTVGAARAGGPGDAIGANHGGLYGNAKVVPHVLRVTEVLDRASWLGTDLTLTGAGFTGSEQVTVGGSSAPVVLATSGLPYSMTVALGPTAPGPTEVVVTRPGASDVGQVALLPTLAIKSTGLGGDATIDLQATGVGIAVLGLSGLAMPPVPIPPSWHGLELDPTAGFTVLAVASPGASGAHQWSLPVPSTPSLAGVTVHLQAWAMEGFFSPATSSFSNRVALTL